MAMSLKLLETTTVSPQPEGHTDYDECLIEKLWQDLEGQVSREQIDQVVTEISFRFQDASVTAFIPIFIRRLAFEELKDMSEKGGGRKDAKNPGNSLPV
jgi:hypothetical protein